VDTRIIWSVSTALVSWEHVEGVTAGIEGDFLGTVSGRPEVARALLEEQGAEPREASFSWVP
jgi:hypothetical protein